MKKSFKLKGVAVDIVRNIEEKQPDVRGKKVPPAQVVDKDGHWVQVEFLEGPNKGNRIPATKELLTEAKT